MTLGEALAVLAAFVGVVLGLAAITGLAARLILLPWLRVHLIEPIGAKVAEATTQWALAAYMFDTHINNSSDEVARLWAAIEELRRERKP